jgi:hypothetical protein
MPHNLGFADEPYQVRSSARYPPNDHMSGRCRTGEGVKPALESVRAAQKDVTVARGSSQSGRNSCS